MRDTGKDEYMETAYRDIDPGDILGRHIRSAALDISKMVANKNADYGSSFEKTLNEYGDKALIIRLSDKLERLKTLEASDMQYIDDERVEDTIQDIAGYCILRLALARTDQ
ncbi:nucleotide modification associated domain-containing protein [Salibacterium lacus]|uniref:Nucleotide modification associated domain-containing protein n=1 Tax=Salibacterium lacus TaxID=1898109 RepID=A0ABW5SY08_9BACI